MKFKSGPFAMTDIHNAGSIFGTIYIQHLHFYKESKVSLHNEVLISCGLPEWQQYLESQKWEGSYSIDKDDKHVKCVLTNLETKATQTIYADFASEEMLICEVYHGETLHGEGKVFVKK